MARKRYNGEGTYSKKRADGRYEWRYRCDGIKRSIYATTQKKLREKVKIFLDNLEKKNCYDFDNMLFGDYLKHDLEDRRKLSLKSTTYHLYTTIVEQHIKGSCIDVPLKDLDDVMLQKYFIKMSNTFSYESLKRLKGIISSTLSNAYVKKRIISNPLELVEIPSKSNCNSSNNKKRTFLSQDEFFSLYDIVLEDSEIDTRLKAVTTILLFTGLRIGETLGLKWQDVDFSGETLLIERRIKRETLEKEEQKIGFPKTAILEADPKTENGKRGIPLPSEVVNILRELKKHQEKAKENAYDLYENNDYVFATDLGKAVDSRNELRRFKRFLKRVNFRTDISFHSLRHSYASFLIEKGVNIETVSKLLGHSDATITLKIYSHITSKEKKEAIKVFKRG